MLIFKIFLRHSDFSVYNNENTNREKGLDVLQYKDLFYATMEDCKEI